MSAFLVLILIMHYLYTYNVLSSENDQIIGDYNKRSVCITDKHDTVSSFYHQITYDPRTKTQDNGAKLLCNNRSIWISEDSKYVIYYQLFTDSMVSYKENVAGFAVFECAQDSYLTALKSQPIDISSDNLCVSPDSIYPDSYPGQQCSAKPLVYCLPFDASKCPQFQMTMDSMYNAVDIKQDIVEMHHFYECQCWFKANDNGDSNNDKRMSIVMNFNENCQEIQKQKKIKEDEESERLLSYHQKEIERREKEEENVDAEEDKIELEKNREFSILWATLGFIIGVILLIIIAIYSCRKQYHKKMYLTSRKYMRDAHFGDIENDNLITHDTDGSDTDSELSSDEFGSTNDRDSDLTDLSNELAFGSEGGHPTKATTL